MGMKRTGRILAALLAAVACCGCSAGKQHVSDHTAAEGLGRLGSIAVTAREDGSGTRAVFAGLVGFDTANQENGASDRTRADAIVKESAEDMIKQVGSTENAIGYVSMGSLKDAVGVKVLQVEGIGLSTETVEKGNYPLSRSFYVAYYDKEDELREEFLRFLKGKGQEIVAESYVAIAKSSTFLSMEPKGTLELNGSTSVAPLMEVIAEEYMKQNPNAELVVTESDSSKGLNAVITGKADIALSSRELKEYEKQLLDYEIFAKEGIAVIVHESNPLENISLEQLKAVYTGEIERWQQLN